MCKHAAHNTRHSCALSPHHCRRSRALVGPFSPFCCLSSSSPPPPPRETTFPPSSVGRYTIVHPRYRARISTLGFPRSSVSISSRARTVLVSRAITIHAFPFEDGRKETSVHGFFSAGSAAALTAVRGRAALAIYNRADCRLRSFPERAVRKRWPVVGYFCPTKPGLIKYAIVVSVPAIKASRHVVFTAAARPEIVKRAPLAVPRLRLIAKLFRASRALPAPLPARSRRFP